MNLSTYLRDARHTQADFARALHVSTGLVSQWLTGRRPISIEKCVQIERITGGAITRRELRPEDWHLIWPEMADKPSSASADLPLGPATTEAI